MTGRKEEEQNKRHLVTDKTPAADNFGHYPLSAEKLSSKYKEARAYWLEPPIL
jgi:hypothetical protein